MKFSLEEKLEARVITPNIGNVYAVRGGTGAKHGHMIIIVSMMHEICTTLTINKAGDIVSGSNYGQHYFEDKCPMAYCDGLDALNFEIKSI